jgi:hypothetical protein
MGGFAVDVSYHKGLPFRGRVTITPSGLLFLATYAPKLIPSISPAEIGDKSKSDSLGKFLACTQAVWFCLQCISRMSQGLSISLLELNTYAHGLCALFVYTQWWNKLLSITEPSLSTSGGDNAVDIWCLLFMVSVPSGTGSIKSRKGFLRRHGTRGQDPTKLDSRHRQFFESST